MNQHDHEVKYLSRKALDILMPYLPNLKALNPSNGNMMENSSSELNSEANSSLNTNENDWIRWTTKIFNEESCSMDSNNFLIYINKSILIKNIHYIYFMGANASLDIFFIII